MVGTNAVDRMRSEMLRRYGRKQGVLRAWRAQLAFLGGRFEPYEAIRWSQASRLVFVCRGNICRSPYAEARARQLGLATTSCGLETRGGVPADPVAARIAMLRGVDLAGHCSRSAFGLRLGPEDLLVAMEPGHLPAVEKLARAVRAQVTLLGLWATPVRPHLEDPFGLSEAWFQTCFAFIDTGVEGLAVELSQGWGSPRRARSVS